MSIGHHRVILPELLDDASPDVARVNLRDLVRINRYLGGHAILQRLMAGFVRPEESFSMLDVGAASGDMAAVLRRRYPRATITSLDRKSMHLEQAAHPKLAADAFLLPFAARSFDFVFSSLFLHHFTDNQVVDLFGNFQTARLVHFLCMTGIVLFMIVHVALALLVPHTLLAMFTGGPALDRYQPASGQAAPVSVPAPSPASQAVAPQAAEAQRQTVEAAPAAEATVVAAVPEPDPNLHIEVERKP